jgi:hypothetical protein
MKPSEKQSVLGVGRLPLGVGLLLLGVGLLLLGAGLLLLGAGLLLLGVALSLPLVLRHWVRGVSSGSCYSLGGRRLVPAWVACFL